MIYTYPGTEFGPSAISSMDALAAMYAEGLSVPRSTDLLFRIESQKQAFIRADLGVAEQSVQRDHVRFALTGLMTVGALQMERGGARDANNHPVNCYSTTAEFPGVIADYNNRYLSILSNALGDEPHVVEQGALSGLAVAYHLEDMPLSRIPRAASERCTVAAGEGGIVHRALAGLATFHGIEGVVEEIISRQVAQTCDATYQCSPRRTRAADSKAYVAARKRKIE